MFDMDTLSKLGALIGVVITFRFALSNLLLSHQKKFKEDYSFAKEFFGSDATPAEQSFIKELGYQAVAGTNQIEGKVIQYLLALDPTGQALRWYPDSKGYISSSKTSGDVLFAFVSILKANGARHALKVFYSIAIAISYLCVVLIVLTFLIGQGKIDSLAALLLGGIGWGLAFYLTVQELGHLSKAEKIIALQSVGLSHLSKLSSIEIADVPSSAITGNHLADISTNHLEPTETTK